MPVLERVARPNRNRVSIEIPREYGSCSFRVILIPIEEEKKSNYDFSEFVGKIKWKGDAVDYQRKLRDEW